jgi:pimeloyl-ACP methyl ester carboxylesterase
MRFEEDGTVTVEPRGAAIGFYADCSPEDVREAVGRLGRQSAASMGQVLTGAAWHDVPATYVVCLEDRAAIPEWQRATAAYIGAEVVEFPTSHSPFFSRPELVADLLARLAHRAA